MKKFLLVTIPVLCLTMVLVLGLETIGLSDLLNVSSDKKGFVGDVVYAENNLGFVLEQKTKGNTVNYVKGKSIVGECVWIKGGKDKLNYIGDRLGLFVLDKYYVGDSLIIEGVSSLLKYKIEERRANVQICVDSRGVITVASPIIYGSY